MEYPDTCAANRPGRFAALSDRKLQKVILHPVLHIPDVYNRLFAPERRGHPESALRQIATKFPISSEIGENRNEFSPVFLKIFVRGVHINVTIKGSTNSYKQFPHSFQHCENRVFAAVSWRIRKKWNPPDRDFHPSESGKIC